ncbi:hypothetical protein [Jatrophihabitans endophyticus]|uniref:hypothetical protein n=1 Tax=Jatrophihabitans endophyticus TaxID=1206085 RepID=UPI0019F0C050|nr:hypothetical protein [Jatrophihabitans endophyticus]MBE7189683.1 hypothetical protein [Jatrophihabitans endophyticus]
MSRELDAEAERRKLAHALGVGTDRLGMLGGVPADQVRVLREQIAEAMFQADKHYFARVATLSKTVPVAVSAKLTELTLPPLLAARTSELLEPAKAVDLVARLSDRYLADVSAVMDPARSPEVIAAIPPERVVTINRELVRRREWVVIGGFASVISEPALRASVATYDGEQLLRIGFVLDDLDKIDLISGMLTDAQVDGMLAAAVEHELWAELADQVEHLRSERLARVARRFAAAPEDVRSGLRDAAACGRFDTAALALLDT